MRWILVFILLYLIPLIVLFKNYKNFKRACIYGSIYVILSTIMVITNIYLSGIRVFEDMLDYEDGLVIETYLNQYEIESVDVDKKEIIQKSDLQQIDKFKKDIYSIEKVALIPMRECLYYTNNLQKDLTSLTKIEDDAIHAKEMCEDVVKKYNTMKVPTLSKKKYTEILDRARINVKKTYELRALAMENSINLIDTKNPIYIKKITEYLRLSDKEIISFKEKINSLKRAINEE